MDQLLGPQSIGVVAGLLIILGAGAKGIWIFSFQAKNELESKDAIIEELRSQISAQRQGSQDRLEEMKRDRDEYRDLVFALTDISKRQVAVAEKTVST